METTVREVTEKVVGIREACGLPTWVSDRTIHLKKERDKAKKQFALSKTLQSRKRWRKLNASLNVSYKADEATTLNRQMDDLKLADETGNYTATWSIINDLSGKNTRRNVKVKKRDGSAASSEQEVLEEWRNYFGALLNNDNGTIPSELPLLQQKTF